MHLRRAQAAQAAQVGAKEQEVLANAARQLALEASKPQAKQAPQATAQRKRPIAPPAAGGRGGGGSQNQLNRGAADWAEAKRKSLGIASDAPPPQLSLHGDNTSQKGSAMFRRNAQAPGSPGARLSELTFGAKVHVWWPRDRVWYPGTISGSHDGLHHVNYDDGERWAHDMQRTHWVL